MEAPKIKMMRTDSLIPYVMNARTHSPDQVNQIAASIKEFGFTNPILVDGEKGLIADHGRLMAAQKLELKEVPVIELTHLSETQKKAYILADNKLALNADWDNELVKFEIEALKAEGYEIELLGFDADELDIIIKGWDSDIVIPEIKESSGFKITVSGSNELDKDNLLDLIGRTIAASGIEGIKLA